MNQQEHQYYSVLPEIRAYATEVLAENEDRSLYTNVGRLYRMEKYFNLISQEENLLEEDLFSLKLLLYTNLVHNAKSHQDRFDIDKSIQHAQKTAKKIVKKFNLPEEILNRLVKAIKEAMPGTVATLPEAKVMHDAVLMDFTGSRGRDRLKLVYEEMLLRDIELPQESWYDTLISIVDRQQTYTSYGKLHIEPEVEKLAKKLHKEKKEVEHKNSLLLKKELNINESEIKELRKNIKAAAGRDERAIQTLFRTTIKNHYTLNEMVDRKSNIMITVNSIILSLIMGGIFGGDFAFSVKSLPIILLSITCITSIVFAVISIIPAKTQGDFSEEEIRNKEGNLLYFGNFHNMHPRDFEWGFLQLLNDKEYLYGSMIRDYYFQGINLDKKYKSIRISLRTFLIGFGISSTLFLFSQFLMK